MKYRIILSLFAFCATLFLFAQPKNASKSLLRITTYDVKGQPYKTGYAFFIASDGTALSNYTLFEYAKRAEAVDEKGNKYEVSHIKGANSLIDMVKFQVGGAKNVPYLPLVSKSLPAKGTKAYLIAKEEGRSAAAIPADVTKVSPYESLNYYDIAADNQDKYVGCPLVNGNGEVVGMYQKNVTREATTACAIDSRFADSLRISSTSGFNRDLQKILIRKALPEKASEAQAFIYLQNAGDSANYISLLNDFVEKFPENAEGYVDRANFFTSRLDFARAEADFQRALGIASKKGSRIGEDEVRFAIGKAIYSKLLYAPNVPFASWTLDRAIEENRKANALKANMLYTKQEGIYLMAKQDYAGAYAAFAKVNQSDFASPGSYLYTAQCVELQKGDTALLSSLLDSMIYKCAQPVNADGAPYLLYRSGFYNRMGRYRAALHDLNQYEKVIGAERLGAQFYYTREQVAFPARLYQLALNDIQRAMALEPENPLFPLEEAMIYLNAGSFDEAMEKANALLAKYPDNPDCYKILGIAHGEKGNKAEAIPLLEKAKALGDDSVERFLERYKK